MKFAKGFTLIELIIVISIIGVLATVLLAIINPLEQLAKGRDAGRESTVTQLGKAMQAYYNSQLAFPAASASWITNNLGSSGTKDISQTPGQDTTTSVRCTIAANHENNWCYAPLGSSPYTDATIWIGAESATSKKYAGCTGTDVAVFVWVASQGKTGVACLTNLTAAIPTATISIK